jgi:anti-sigma regulatory factor (Ser/Thr protein kinase)
MTTIAAGQPTGTTTLPEPGTDYQRTYPGRADQLRHVRQDIAEQLRECPVTDDVILIASEFGANAILHSRSRGGHFTIRVKLRGEYLRLECHDTGGPWRGRRHATGRPHGLDIVEALTGPDHWGTEQTPGGTRVVWATLEWSPRTEDARQ